MPEYAMDSHEISFADDFKKIVVQPDNGAPVIFPLVNAGKAVKVELIGESYQVSEVDRPSMPSLDIFTYPPTEISIEGAKVGGIVIIDLRDIGRSEESDVQPCDVESQLDCATHYFWNIGSGKALKIFVADINCLSTTPRNGSEE